MELCSIIPIYGKPRTKMEKINKYKKEIWFGMSMIGITLIALCIEGNLQIFGVIGFPLFIISLIKFCNAICSKDSLNE